MWDEEINKKIKDAADQYHPAYDDNAWNKMEQLLDEHLPIKKDRRRIIYFLPLMILFLGGGIFFVISRKQPHVSHKISEKPLPQSTAENLRGSVAVTDPVKSGKGAVGAVDAGNHLSKKTSVNAANAGIKIKDKLFASRNGSLVNRNTRLASKNLSPVDQAKQIEGNWLSSEVNAKRNSIKYGNNIDEPINATGKPINEEKTSPAENASRVNTTNAITIEDDKETVKPKDIAKVENSKKEENNNIRQKKIRKSFVQNFGIGLSVGPDISAVKLSNTGKITLAYGGELSYSFAKKFTLRTGFYFARKIYSVDDNEYHAPPGSVWNTDLQSVDANCKVYEIPLTISYDFGKTKNHSWFISTGLSSYFMKKESYVYYYKNPAGNTWNYPWSVTNQNKHYFSVLDISGGYQYSISKQFSILAEPYLKLPLSGIGLGKIKLNSAGVLFTVAVKPFLK